MGELEKELHWITLKIEIKWIILIFLTYFSGITFDLGKAIKWSVTIRFLNIRDNLI